MIKFKHNGPWVSCWIACWKGYDDVNAPRWNPEIEPFFVRLIVQKEEGTSVLRAIEDHMLP